MKNKGVLVIISGFSGAGKGTIVGKLLKKYDYKLSISATTRNPREGEKEGVNYFYKTKDEFEKMIEEDAFIEYAKYVDNYYGTPKAYVMDCLENGNDVILEIEMQGALKVKEKFPEVALIFVTPPSALELKNRLVNRGTETEDVISKRMMRAKEECAYIDKYDYVVVNDDLDLCVEEINDLIKSIHYTRENQNEFIDKIKEDIKNF